MGTGWTVYPLTILFAKLALFLLYYRLFASHRGTRIAINLGIAVNGLFYVATVVYFLSLCIPKPGGSWSLTKCGRTVKMPNIQCAFGLASDLYIFILPLPVLLKMQMPLKKKIGVVATFSTGLM